MYIEFYDEQHANLVLLVVFELIKLGTKRTFLSIDNLSLHDQMFIDGKQPETISLWKFIEDLVLLVILILKKSIVMF